MTHTLAQTLREHSQTVIDEQKSKVAAEIQHFGAAVRSAADRLNDDQSTALARYADTAAESIDGIAQYVEELELTDLAREVERFARQRPGLLVGGLFFVGMGVARFIKAGTQPASSQQQRRGRGTASEGRTGRRRRARKSRGSAKD